MNSGGGDNIRLKIEGTRLAIGFNAWYFSVYYKPWEGPADMITRLWDRWQERADAQKLRWSGRRGATAKFGVATMWAWTAELVSARSLTPAKQAALLFPWNRLWLACGYTGRICLGEASLEVQAGRIPDRAAVIAAWQQTFPHLPAKRFAEALDMMQVTTMPGVAFALHRLCSLSTRDQAWAGQPAASAVALAHSCIAIIESRLPHLRSKCSEDMPTGAPAAETYRRGRRQARQDPRLKADLSQIHQPQHPFPKHFGFEGLRFLRCGRERGVTSTLVQSKLACGIECAYSNEARCNHE